MQKETTTVNLNRLRKGAHMDLTTRALLLVGIIVGLFVLAGLALVIGKSMMSDNNGESFDVGKGRKKKRKKPTKQQKKLAAAASAGAVSAEPTASTFGANAQSVSTSGVSATPPATPPFIPPAESMPSSQGASPFGGAAQPTEEW